MRCYEVLGTVVGSDIPLPEVPPTEETERPEIRLLAALHEAPWPRLAHAGPQPCRNRWVPQRTRAGLVLRQPGLVDVLVSAEADVLRYRREPPAPDAALRSALIDQVLPRAIAHRGGLVIHAGTVAIAGRAFCLAGPSGMGKSTLVMAFSQAGHGALADDAARLQPTPRGVDCTPSYPGARLLRDSVAALGATPTGGLVPTLNRGKFRCEVPNGPTGERPLPLGGIIFLDRKPGQEQPTPGAEEGPSPKLRALAPAEALAGLMSHTFVLDRADSKTIARLFAQASRIIGCVPAHVWSFSSGYGRLHELVRQLAATLAR